MDTSKQLSRTKLERVNCRLCYKEMSRQSYREHLRDIHNETKDLRPLGVKPIANFFVPKGRINTATVKNPQSGPAPNTAEVNEAMIYPAPTPPSPSTSAPAKAARNTQMNQGRPKRGEKRKADNERRSEGSSLHAEVPLPNEDAGEEEELPPGTLRGLFHRMRQEMEQQSDEEVHNETERTEAPGSTGVENLVSDLEHQSNDELHNETNRTEVSGAAGDVNVVPGLDEIDQNGNEDVITAEDRNNNQTINVISRKLELLTNKITSSLNISDCANESEVIGRRLDLLDKTIDTQDGIRKLEKVLGSYKEVLGVKTDEIKNPELVDYDLILKTARSLKEICDKTCIFEYREFRDDGTMLCVVCGESFKYSCTFADDFSTGKISKEFSNLKRHLKGHLQSLKHRTKASENAAALLTSTKEDARNTAIGLRVGNIVYFLVKNGRPDSDFPVLIQISVANNSDMGDINHSKKFVTSFLPTLADTVRGRLIRHLATPLLATGCKSPVNLMSDKATHQRNTRQLTGALMLNPGGPQLIVAVFFDAPLCPGGNGTQLKDNIVSAVHKFVTPDQMVGFTGDGVYANCRVGSELDAHYRINLFFTWDQMHVAATVDTALKNPKKPHAPQFEWINKMTVVISKGVKFIGWGKEWDRFFKVSIELVQKALESEGEFEFEACRPGNFSETKMANHAAQVYIKFRKVYPALVITLEKVKEEFRTGFSTEREKAAKADEIQSGILNVTFTLSLSALADIYSTYGAISKILQVINMLPFQRMDKFNRLIRQFEEMIETVDPLDCPRHIFSLENQIDETFPTGDTMSKSEGIINEVCCWKMLHKDIGELRSKTSYRGVVMGQLREELVHTTRTASQTDREWLLVDQSSVISKVLQRAKDVTVFLSSGLKEKVYTEGDVTAINYTRQLLDIKSLMKKIQARGASYTASQEWIRFYGAATYLEMPYEVSYGELRLQFREFNRRLGRILDEDKMADQRSNLDFLGMFLDPKNDLYKDIEAVLSVMARAVMVKGIEAVVESWVSVLENHSSSARGITDQDRLINEVFVGINGPEVHNCSGIVREAMRKYWQKSKQEGSRLGHFVRRSENIKSYVVSEVVDNMRNSPPKFPFMM